MLWDKQNKTHKFRKSRLRLGKTPSLLSFGPILKIQQFENLKIYLTIIP